MAYTVQKLTSLSGVSVRTLHHYDEGGKKGGLAERASFYLGHPDWKKTFDPYHPKLQEFILTATEAYENG